MLWGASGRPEDQPIADMADSSHTEPMLTRTIPALLVLAMSAGVPHQAIGAAGSAPADVAEPGYQCDFETRGSFGTISAHFDVPRSGAAPRGSVRWEAWRDRSDPLLFGAEWSLTRSRHFRRDDGSARITAPLPPVAETSPYIGLYVRSDPNSRFSNPTILDKSMLDGGGGLVHMGGDNLYFFNVGWRKVVAFGRRHSRLYLFGVQNMALNRPVILAKYEIDPTPFLQADDPVQAALDKVEHMIADPARSCSAVDALPPPPIFVS